MDTHKHLILLLAVIGLAACEGKLSSNAIEGVAGQTDDPTSSATDPEDPPEFDGTIPDADACEGVAVDPGPALARRLTNWEYVNTVQQTFGVDIAAEAVEMLPEDLRAGGFSNHNDALLVTLNHTEGYADLAIALVSKLDWTAWVDARSCTEQSTTCAQEFVTAAGAQTFRRPLNTEEIDLFVPLFDVAAAEGDDFYMGAELVLRAMLQSPQFLYRMEAGGSSQVDPHGNLAISGFEMASRLSYLIWHSSPDDALINAAAADQLRTPEQIGAQVDRMLQDPRAREASLRYVNDWLGLDGLDGTVRDAELYPDFSPARVEAMKQETLDFFAELIWEERAPMLSMFTAEYTVVGRELAEFYGFDGVQDGVNRYDLSDDPTRMGFLTHAGILTMAGKSDQPSLVERGIYVFDGMLCGTIVAPPVGVTDIVGEPEPGKSARFYAQERLDNDGCKGCHIQFDPVGFAFERYDGIGAYLTHDEFGNELRADGTFLDPGSGETTEFMVTEDFLAAVASSEGARDCLIQKPAQFALGRALLQTDACTLAGIKSSLDLDTATYHDLIRQIALAPAFAVVKADTETPETTP